MTDGRYNLSKVINRYKALSIQTRAVLWFTGCNFLQKGISYITVPIFTRMMSTEEYGIYSLYSSWYQILLIITSLYLFNGVFDNAMSKFAEDRDRFTSAVQGLSITVTLFVFMIYLVSNNAWENLLGLPKVYIALMFAEMLVSPAMFYWTGRQRFEYRYKRLVFLTIAKSLINPLLGLILVYGATDRALGRVISIVVTELVFDVAIMIHQFVKGRVFFDQEYWKYAVTLAIPLIPHYLSGMVLNQGDKVVIDRLVDKSAVAIYGVAYSIGMLVQIFVRAINSAITPWIYAQLKSREIKEIRSRFVFLLLFVAMLICGIVFIGPELVLIFGSEEYAKAVYVIPPVAASVYFIFLYGVLAVPEFYYEKTKFLMLASFGAAALNIFLNLIFVKLYGFVAAGYTTLVCYIVYSLGHYIVGKRVLNQNIPDTSMVDEKTTLLISVVVIAISIVGNILVPYVVVRYGILLFIMLMAYIRRERWIRMFKEIRQRD